MSKWDGEREKQAASLDALDGGNKSFNAGQLELRYVEMKNSDKTHLTLERPAKICIIVDQPGLVGPLSTFFAKAL